MRYRDYEPYHREPPFWLRPLFWLYYSISHALAVTLLCIGGFLLEWFRSRAPLALLVGLPAGATLVVVGLLVMRGGSLSHPQLVSRYYASAQTALDAGQLDAARLYFQRLIQWDAMDEVAVDGLSAVARRERENAPARVSNSRLADHSRNE